MRTSGYVVRHNKTNSVGRTFHNKKLIQGKIPVYYENGKGYEERAVLCSPENLTIIGFVD